MERGTSSESRESHELVQRLFVQHLHQIRGYARVICPDVAILDDVVQEVFVAMMSRASDFADGRNFKSWAYGFVRNKAMKAATRRKADARLLGNDVLELLSAAVPELEVRPEELGALRRCLAELAPSARSVIRQRYENGLQPQQVASAMGWTPNSVRVALSRARAFLRACVEQRLAASGARATP